MAGVLRESKEVGEGGGERGRRGEIKTERQEGRDKEGSKADIQSLF